MPRPSKPWRRRLKYLAIAAVVTVLAALGLPYLIWRPLPTHLPAVGDRAGTLIYIVGWNGPIRRDRNVLNALHDAGCNMAMETFDWTAGQRSLIAFWRAQHSAEPAIQLANHIQAVQQEHSGQPIFLIADSSGCAVALAALANLPPQVKVKTLILSSPAVSPTYDLRPALRHIDDKLVSFNSHRDFIILGLGSIIFGTVDGRHTAAAGRRGFVIPPGAVEYAKLRQIPYDPAWAVQFGNTGGHGQALNPRFAKALIAPLLAD
jgi:pimeloyl-ACP methyl ester carboxylesterase